MKFDASRRCDASFYTKFNAARLAGKREDGEERAQFNGVAPVRVCATPLYEYQNVIEIAERGAGGRRTL